jgi:hypothetical protein
MVAEIVSQFRGYIGLLIYSYDLASWRAPFGQSGVLKFFLDVISLKDEVDSSLLLHSLRVIGNSCADTGIVGMLSFVCR